MHLAPADCRARIARQRLALHAAMMAVLLFFAPASELHAGNVELTSIETTVSDLERARSFYIDVLQFRVISESRASERSTATLQLGEETLVLVDPKADGRPIPPDMPSNDRLFQHIAIVVSDMDAAYRRLVSGRVTIVSDGPQTLPGWNFDAAGIRALYFRDPDGHFLELIEFPPAKGEPKWRRRDGQLFLGIDHTAIVVRDMQASRHFYRDLLGMTITGSSLNYGAEQESLNGVPASKVKITGLRGAKGPGIELLQYLQPGTADTFTGDPVDNDLLHWQINLRARRFAAGDSGSTRRDPDGHVLRLTRSDDAEPFEFMFEALRQHWPRYLMEAAQLGIFMIVTLYLTIVLEHPGSPIRRAIASGLLRRVLMGTGIGLTVAVLIYCD